MIHKEVPHVLNLTDGLREIDHISTSPDQFCEYILRQKYLDHGSQAISFVIDSLPGLEIIAEPHNIVRLPYYNFLGRAKMIEILSAFSSLIPKSDKKYLVALQDIQNLSDAEYQQIAKKKLVQLLIHVAAANSRFRHNPRKTIPINTFFQVDGKPIATLEKMIQGKKPLFEREINNLSEEIIDMGSEFAIGNVFFDVSPYLDDNNQVVFLHPYHIIDFNVFIPSNY